MNLNFLTEYMNLSILAICLGAGYIMKNFMPTDNKYIPLALGCCGTIFGLIAIRPFSIDSIAIGLVSGLAATGLHQVFKQFLHVSDNDTEK